MTKYSLLFLAAAAGLAGCDLLHAATAEKLDADQRTAFGDLLGQTGSLASVIADPGMASSNDVADAMALGHFVRLVKPGATSASPRTTAAGAAAAPAPECITEAGNTVTATDCQVPVGERTCLVNATFTGVDAEGGRRYAGSARMTGEGCPQRTITADFLLQGATDNPTGLDGTIDFSENNPPQNIFNGTLTYAGIGLSDGCTKPSKGTATVDVSGTYGGEPVEDSITVSFNDSPECGVLLIE